MLWSLLALLLALLLWALIGKLDIVAVAEGKLIPSYVKIVQPAESGIVKDILAGKGKASTRRSGADAHGYIDQRSR